MRVYCSPNSEDENFCIVEEDGVYVDLIKNPEGYTGFKGPSASRIWSAIYESNCFQSPYDHLLPNGDNWGTCVEKQLFYRIISGLHSSVSTHVCTRFFDSKQKVWTTNRNFFRFMIGAHEDRIQNLAFLHISLAKAVKVVHKKMLSYNFYPETDSENEAIKVRKTDSYHRKRLKCCM